MKLFFTVYLMVIACFCNAQSIDASYREKRLTGEGSPVLTFDKGKFKEQFIGDLQSKFGAGTYSIKNNKLTLTYQV